MIIISVFPRLRRGKTDLYIVVFYKFFKAYYTDYFTKYSCHLKDGIKRFAKAAGR